MKNVLFLCTGNSCRSVLAEAYMNAAGAGRWQAFSAGSTPTGTVHPKALATLKELGLIHTGYRSKSWDEFARQAAPEMDLIVTVCDNAAGEACPVWPGHPATAHWPFPDPAKYQVSEETVQVHFREVFAVIKKRLDAFLAAEGK